MFYKYEIKNNGIEDILYLYLNMTYEFSKELGVNSNNDEIARRTKNFIKNNNINYDGEKVYLVIDGIIVKSVDISKNKVEIEKLTEELFYSNDSYMVNVKLDNNVTIEITLNDYLLGALANIYSNELEEETLKAIAILYRTYVFKEMNEKKFVFASNNFINYRPISYYKLTWLNNFKNIRDLLDKVIDDTDCLFLTYNQYYILPFIHYTNYGKTLESDKYPYLTSVSSIWDLSSPCYINIDDYSYKKLSKIFKDNIVPSSIIQITDIDKFGFINKIRINNSIYTGNELIDLLNLKSRALNIIINKDFIRFISKGFGEFYGLSIYGSNELAKNGGTFKSILSYYFPKVIINKYIKELP